MKKAMICAAFLFSPLALATEDLQLTIAAEHESEADRLWAVSATVTASNLEPVQFASKPEGNGDRRILRIIPKMLPNKLIELRIELANEVAGKETVLKQATVVNKSGEPVEVAADGGSRNSRIKINVTPLLL